MNDFTCFYREFVTTVDGRQQQKIVLVAKNGTSFYTPFLSAKIEYNNFVLNIILLFHLGTVKLAKAVLASIPVPSHCKLKTVFELHTVNLMVGSGLESHQTFRCVK